MVYNAMKLFMEVDPQLFDDCSHEYTESQNNADQRSLKRQHKWDQIAQQAKARQNGRVDSVHEPMQTTEPMQISKTHTPVLTPIPSEGAEHSIQESVRNFEEMQIHDGPAPARPQPLLQSQPSSQTHLAPASPMQVQTPPQDL